MNARTQIICAWCGILCPIIMFLGLWPVAGFMPPHLPTASAADIAAIYQQNTNSIRFGCILIIISGALYGPYTAAIAGQMRRMEHRETPVLTYSQLSAGIATILLFLIPALIWSVAAFRPDRPAEIIRTLNDLGWFFFLMPFVLGFLQNFVIGFAVLGDRNTPRIFPRWVGFFNFWIALLFIPGCLLTFFKAGPFAWNGILAFWVPAIIFGPWFLVMSTYVIKAVKQQATASKP